MCIGLDEGKRVTLSRMLGGFGTRMGGKLHKSHIILSIVQSLM